MTGLEKILKSIEDDANANAKVIIDQATREADEIINDAKAEADKKCAEIYAKSDADVEEVINRAKSSAKLLERKALLDAKQMMINDVLIEARNSLMKLTDAEYTEIILRMIKKYAHNKPGQILFSKEDKKRLPKDFDIILKKSLENQAEASLTFSEENSEITEGFILRYGDIEENCSFDALFNAAKEELQDKVNTILFNQNEISSQFSCDK